MNINTLFSTGVRLNSWKGVRQCVVNINNPSDKWIYEKVAFRHVNMLRNKEFFKKIYAFTMDTLDKDYSCSYSKLLMRKSVPLKESIQVDNNSDYDIFSSINDGAFFKNIDEKEPEQKKFVNKDRTFFCSELVAKAYKTLGIIANDDTSCTQFYPSHFTSMGDSFLQLQQNITIDEEKVVILDREFREELPYYA